MKSRLIYGWALFFAAIGSLLAGGLIFATGMIFVAVIAGNEYIGMMRAKGIHPSPRIIRGMTIAFFLLASFQRIVRHLPADWHLNLPLDFGMAHYPLLLTVGVCISFFRLLFRHEQPPATIADIATTILGFIYIGWLPSHLVLLRNLVPPGAADTLNPIKQPGLAYVWAALFIVFATDVFAYYAGKHFGKHLLYPQVSPKKTVEGAIGGFIAAIFWATLVVYLSDNFFFPEKPFQGKLWQAPLMGAFVSVAAQLGDLCESLLKRDAGVKDSGTSIPGHGGILDRGDGLIFASAVSYYWVCGVVLGIF
jgi:phosphatidate cytidylyltransferase